MRVALDLEDVLVENVRNFIEELNDFLRNEHGLERSFETEDVRGWRFRGVRDELAELQGWEENHTRKFMYGDKRNWPGFIPITERIWREERSRIEPREENILGKIGRIRQVADVEELSIVTARENVDKELKHRLRELGISKRVDNVIIEKEKEKLGFDIYIDDHPKLHERLENGKQLIVDQPWNRREPRSQKRIEKISEATEVIRDLD